LNFYFLKAKVKPVYHNATFLDPRIKNSFAKNDKQGYKLVKKNFYEALKSYEKSFEEATVENDENCWTSSIYKKKKVCLQTDIFIIVRIY